MSRPSCAERSRSRKVVHLAPGHVPFDTRVFHKEARTLAHDGYDVTIVAPAECDTVMDGVRIVALRPSRSRLDRFVFGPVRLLAAALRLRADIYHLHDIEALPVGIALGLMGRCVIIDSHEDYPRLVLDRPWVPRRIRPFAPRAVMALERCATRVASEVISAEDEGAKRFPVAKTTVVRNFPLAAEFAHPRPRPRTRPNSVVYIGDITTQRGAREMVDAIGAIPDRLDPRLILGGRFNEPHLIDELRESRGWDRTTYLGFLDRASVGEQLAMARVGLVLWHPTKKHAEGAVPVKLYEYLAAGIPVVASDFPAIRDVVDAADAGILVDPFDHEQIVKSLSTLLEDPVLAERMGTNGRRFVLEHRTWESEARKLLAVYERLAP